MAKRTEINIGIIGIGMIGLKHLRDFRSAKNCHVLAIADHNEEVLTRAVEEYSLPYSFTQYKELLVLDELDAVVVCVPPYMQEEICIAALTAKKHVLCEKPMALTPRSAHRIVRTAKKYKKILANCCSRFSFSPTVNKARKMIHDGELGDIYHITMTGISRRYRPCIEFHPSNTWGLDQSKAGGGALMDWGMYDLSILFTLLDDLKVERVDGFCFRGLDSPEIGDMVFNVEEHGGAALRCSDGIVVFWERAWAAHMNSRPRIRIYGSKAGISFDPLALTQDIYFEIYEDRSGKPVTIAPDMHFEHWDIHRSVAFDFIESVLGKHAPKASGEQVAKILEVIHAVYYSNKKQTSVRI
jgi:predicted dehydrogenase